MPEEPNRQSCAISKEPLPRCVTIAVPLYRSIQYKMSLRPEQEAAMIRIRDVEHRGKANQGIMSRNGAGLTPDLTKAVGDVELF